MDVNGCDCGHRVGLALNRPRVAYGRRFDSANADKPRDIGMSLRTLVAAGRAHDSLTVGTALGAVATSAWVGVAALQTTGEPE
jgi:hypothetical protein